VPRVGGAGRLGGIEVDVDHVVERAHRDSDRGAQLRVVELAVRGEVLVERDRTGVERDLGAEVGGVDDPHVVLSLGISIPSPAAGGGDAGAVLLDPRYIKAGSVDSTGYYNHYSALRSYEDLLGITTGGVDGFGHIGLAATTGLRPFGHDVFNKYKAPRKSKK
jgi:hypothetical protein